VVGNWPEVWGGRHFRRLLWAGSFRSFGSGVNLGDQIIIQDPKFITIKQGTGFMRGCSLYADQNGKLNIGSRCSFHQNIILGANGGGIEIGEDVLVGPNTVFRAANHVFSRGDVAIREQGHQGNPIVIEDDVWIGANCVILPGVRIGKGTVVGAGSVVTRDLPPYAICHGAPARFVRTRTTGSPGTDSPHENRTI